MSNLDFNSICEITNAHEQGVFINKINFAISGNDLSTASILSRLVYWFSPSKKNGQLRTRIRKEGRVWIARQNTEWLEECYVTERQVKSVIKKLVKLGLVEVKAFMFDGFRVNHWSLNLERYAELYNEALENSNNDYGQDKLSRPVRTNCPDRSGQNVPTHNNNIRQDPYSSDLKDTVSRTVGVLECSTAVQRIILQKQYEPKSESDALGWLQTFGFKPNVASNILKEYTLDEICASKDYLVEMLNSGKSIKKSVTGYFLAILENRWWMPKVE